ncbi:MAG: cobalamin biosynthesis protein CbiA [Candidatus Zixiibacteriota bacterium]|nr:MAG: cobalamin biosynthesis protein CbiA [candidate division Zixibacteria bacterium]
MLTVPVDEPVLSFQPPTISRGIIVVVGGYGSGKSEVSVNLARHLVTSHPESGPVAIADLDIVNPYFRSREASAALEKLGINTINPKGDQYYSELPIIMPEIKARIQESEGYVILDVGGDDVGARVLSSLADGFAGLDYQMLLVLNANRPFTADLKGSLKVIAEIEAASRLKFTGLVSNTHLMDDTRPETVIDGLKLARAVSRETKLPVVFLSATLDVLEKLDVEEIDVPVLELNRALLKPWEKRK